MVLKIIMKQLHQKKLKALGFDWMFIEINQKKLKSFINPKFIKII